MLFGQHIVSAVIAGVFVILGAVITTYKISSEELKIEDIITSSPYSNVLDLDIRLLNSGDTTIHLSNIKFKLLKINEFKKNIKGHLGFSIKEGVNISELEKVNSESKLIISNTINSGETDRILIRLYNVIKNKEYAKYFKYTLELSINNKDTLAKYKATFFLMR